MEFVTLNNGLKMPKVGFGVYQIKNQEQCKQAVLDAIDAGYRLIDTAQSYGNEEAVGKAIQETQVPRSELFITTKVWISNYGYEKAKASVEESLKKMQLDYIDLVLLHQPFNDYYGAYKALVDLYKEGKIRAIGVCNFEADRLTDLILNNEVTPAVNQMEMHPFCQQKNLRDVMEQYQIKMMAWAPFAEGMNGIFTNELLKSIGETYGKSPAQVILRWMRQNGIIAIPKSVHEERIRENYAIDDFALSPEDMIQISQMDTGRSHILEIRSLAEVYRLFHIRFEQ